AFQVFSRELQRSVTTPRPPGPYRAAMLLLRLAVVACCVSFGCCVSAIGAPAVSPSKPASDALLVLPGFGYSRAGEHALRSLGPSLAAEGIDLYVPTYVARSGLEQSR